MASKKQIAWRKKFAKMAKAGKFKKKKGAKSKKKKTTRIDKVLEEERTRPDTGAW
tara:strand:- start:177 stop:341 length:165 start_codon:yes stop_codon:yes gene_type:complete